MILKNIFGSLTGTKDISNQIKELSKGLGIDTAQTEQNTGAKNRNTTSIWANIFAREAEAAASKKVTAQEMIEAIAINGVSTEQAKQQLVAAGLIQTKGADLVLTDELTEENLEYAASIGVVNGALDAQQKEALENLLMKKQSGKSTVKILGFLASNWKILAVAAGVAAVAAVAYAIHYKNSVKGIIKANQKLIDSNKEVRDSLTEEIDTNTNNASDLQTLYKDYMTAKKGSEEYYDALNKLAELSPELIVGYDNEGNAILANNEKIKEQIKYYEELAEAKREERREAARNAIDGVNGSGGERQSYQQLQDQIAEKQKQFIYSTSNQRVQNVVKTKQGRGQQNVSAEQVMKDINQQLEADIKSLKEQAKVAYESLREQYVDLLPSVDDLTDAQKTMRDGLVETAIQKGWDVKTFESVFAELESIDASKIVKLQLDESLTDEEYRKQATKIYERLAKQFNLTDEAKKAFKIAFGIDEEAIRNAQATRKNNKALLGELLGNDIDERQDDRWSGDRDIASWVDTLSDKDLSLLLKGDFDENATLFQLKSLLKELQEQADKEAISIKTNIEVLSSVDSLSEGFDQLREIYSDIQDGEMFDYSSILNNKDFEEMFGGFDTYENFVETVANSPDDINACQSAFNNLVTEYVYSSEVLQGVTKETKSTTIAMLEQAGVANAEEVVTRQLAINLANLAEAQENVNEIKDKGIDASIDLENATAVEIIGLINEAKAAGLNVDALQNYLIKKTQANQILMSTKGDIQELANLCNSLGIAAQAIEKYNSLKLAKAQQLKYGNSKDATKDIMLEGVTGVDIDFESAEQDIEAEFNKYLSEFITGDYQVDVEWDGGDEFKKSIEDSKEDFDWLETKISRLQRLITNFGKAASATWKSWTDRTSALTKEIAATRTEIEEQQKAYDYYMAEAGKVGLDSTYVTRIQQGDDFIEDGSNISEETREKIEEYRELYEKALAAEDAKFDAEGELRSKIQDSLDLISGEYEAKIGVIEHEMNMIDLAIENAELRGQIIGKSFYENLASLEENKLADLEAQRDKLQKTLDSYVKSGEIKEGTEEWYNLKSQINDVEEAIREAENAIIDYGNSARQADWDIFDKQQEKISQLYSETEFLMDLLDNDDLFDKDNGSMTERGEAAFGLHAINYQAYLEQAEDYAEELAEIEKEIAEEGESNDLLERKQELIEAQRESILNAEAEKEAIRDLYEEYYNNLLDVLQEIIDKRKEALQAEKD